MALCHSACQNALYCALYQKPATTSPMIPQIPASRDRKALNGATFGAAGTVGTHNGSLVSARPLSMRQDMHHTQTGLAVVEMARGCQSNLFNTPKGPEYSKVFQLLGVGSSILILQTRRVLARHPSSDKGHTSGYPIKPYEARQRTGIIA